MQDKINLEGFGLVLLDMRLKDADGIEILQHILKEDPHKKVIIISSYLNTINSIEAKKIGAYKCMGKSSNLFNESDFIMDGL